VRRHLKGGEGDGERVRVAAPPHGQKAVKLAQSRCRSRSGSAGTPRSLQHRADYSDGERSDLSGIQVAYDALEIDLATHGRPLPPPSSAAAEAPYLSQERRFFVAAATVWHAETRDAALVTQLSSDTHAPSAVRGTQPLRNCDAFYDAFAIEPGDPVYLPPEERIVIW